MTVVSAVIIVTASSIIGWIGVAFFGFATLLFLLKLVFPDVKQPSVPNRSHSNSFTDCGVFEYTDAGFIMTSDNRQLEIKWREIETIFGYKVDRYAYDEICMDVFCDHNQSFSISEETPGWFAFVNKTKETFPQIDRSWDIEISTPAFETKLTLVYDREGRTLDDAVKGHYKD